jgi:hypothetical protein
MMNFLDISFETANKFYAGGWRASIIGALVTFFGIGFLYWGTRVRDRELESQIAGRMAPTVTKEQHDLIVALLSPDKIAKGPVLINSLMDGEAWQFGEKILRTLKDAGFDPKRVEFGQQLFGLSVPGAFIWIKEAKNQPKHAGPIFEAFKRAGIILKGEEKPDALPDLETVEIVVGSHP